MSQTASTAGFCLPACPTYVLWGKETDSPRGRIYLMRLGLEGRAPNRRRIHAPHRHLPRVYGVRDRLPLRRQI